MGFFSRTVPGWTVVAGLGIMLAGLPLVLVMESSTVACATAKELVADPQHPDNDITVSNGSIIKVAVPMTGVQALFLPDVSSSNYSIVDVSRTACAEPAHADQVPTFYFQAVSEGSARLQTAGPTPGTDGLFAFAWAPVVWNVTVGPDYRLLGIIGIEAAVAVLAAAYIYIGAASRSRLVNQGTNRLVRLSG